MTTDAIGNILQLPRPERLDALQAVVAAEFRTTLGLEPGESLAVDAGYFDLGLTSLRITETKMRLEGRLGVVISSNVLFSRPTVAQLTVYLAEECLPEVFAGPQDKPGPDDAPGEPAADDERDLLDEFLPGFRNA